MERLIVIPLPSKPGRFSAHLESTGAPVVTNSKQPLVGGARALLAAGFDPATALTMRHDDRPTTASRRSRSAGGSRGLTRREKERPFGQPPGCRFPPGRVPKSRPRSCRLYPKPCRSKNVCTKRHSERPLDARRANVGCLGRARQCRRRDGLVSLPFLECRYASCGGKGEGYQVWLACHFRRSSA